MAERYLTRAASLSSGAGAIGKGGEATGGVRARAAGCGPAEDWLALMEFYSGWWPPSARAAEASVRDRGTAVAGSISWAQGTKQLWCTPPTSHLNLHSAAVPLPPWQPRPINHEELLPKSSHQSELEDPGDPRPPGAAALARSHRHRRRTKESRRLGLYWFIFAVDLGKSPPERGYVA